MSTTPESIIEFLRARATDTPLESAELADFTRELKNQIDQLSVTIPNAADDALTVLYSGLLPDGIHTGSVVADMAENSPPGKVLTISQTEIGSLLDFRNEEFHDALREALADKTEDYRNITAELSLLLDV